MNVVDVCLFAGERAMLELRLRTLRNVVDAFVVVACTHTHQGAPLSEDERYAVDAAYLAAALAADVGGRSLLYWVRPSMTLDHGQGVTFERPPDERGPAGTKWFQHIEKQHRNGMVAAVGALNLAARDVVLMSDVDEIPAPASVAQVCAKLANAAPGRVWYVFAQRFHSDDLRHLHPQQPWFGTCATHYNEMAPQEHRNARTTLGTRREAVRLIADGGWHFSWFGTDDERARKLATFSHAELSGKFDPADGRRSGYHSNGERLLPRLDDEACALLSWPSPLHGTMVIPEVWDNVGLREAL